MRHVDPPRVPSLSRRRLGATDPQVAAWRHRAFALQAHEDPSTLGADPDQLLWALIEVERRRGLGTPYERKLQQAMAELTPVLSHPRTDDVIDDLAIAMAQPEILDLWPRWDSPRPYGTPGPAPTADASAKALLACMGMLGRSTHADDAHTDLKRMPDLRQLFAGVELAAARRADLPDPDPFTVMSYSATMARVKPLTRASTFRPLQLRAKAKMLAALKELLPDAGIGEGLYLDGRLFPAWQLQVGDRQSRELLKRLKAQVPWSGARSIRYGRKRKRDLRSDEMLSSRDLEGSVFFARGAYEITLLEAATGWPLVSTIWPGDWDEALALVPLLSDLFRHFRGVIDPKWLATDGAWDEEWAHRLCEVEYGFALIARDTGRLQPGPGETPEPDTRNIEHRSIAGSSSDTGRLVEAEHGELVDFEGFTRPDFEEGCYPGHAVKGQRETVEYAENIARREAGFRLRAKRGKEGATDYRRYSVPVSHDWRRLCAYPRYPEGNLKLFAFRQAVNMRLRNLMEGHHARIAVGFKLFNKGADRLRLRDRDKLEALVGLAELRICALSLADVRETLGQPVAPLPEDAPVGDVPSPRRRAAAASAPEASTTPRSRAKATKLGVRPGASTLVTRGGAGTAAQPAETAVTSVTPGADNVIAVDFTARRRKA